MVVVTLSLLVVGPAVLFLSDFLEGPKANLWLFLLELHSIPLEIRPRYNTRWISWIPEPSTQCYKSNANSKVYLACFYDSIAGELSPTALEVWEE